MGLPHGNDVAGRPDPFFCISALSKSLAFGGQRIERIEIVPDSDASIDAWPNNVFSSRWARGSKYLWILDAMMSPTESPGADGTLPVSVVNRPIRSSLEAGQDPPRIDETSTALSPTRRTPEDPEAGEVLARDPPTSTDVELLRIERIEIVPNSDASIDAVIAAPTLSLTVWPNNVFSSRWARGSKYLWDSGCYDEPTESPGADGTLPVSVVNRPIRSSLEAGQDPPRIDETSTALSPTRRTPEDPEAGEVLARDPPTSTDVELLMEAIKIFIVFLTIVMVLVIVLVPSNKHVKFAVVVLDLLSWVTTVIIYVAKILKKYS
ncbi:hypothetical protein CJ030_MR1G028916 [Morella rubra]|uniref:Uncharacterized protein n=1 Tax=Morella rubra TaxID=262757 RepID=A0A6A1WR58_9ROSI|nr:hypothetical protein CJ030_MR1G028916 [Morella rubra]